MLQNMSSNASLHKCIEKRIYIYYQRLLLPLVMGFKFFLKIGDFDYFFLSTFPNLIK